MFRNRTIHFESTINSINWPLSILLIIASSIRLYRLGQESFTLDEIGQVLVAENSWWLTILRSVHHHGNTPLDYLITHISLYFGQSESIQRFPSVIWGVLSILIIYKLGWYMFDKPTGYLAACLLAILPLHVLFSRTTRFYSLAILLILLGLLVFNRAIEKNTGLLWVLYGIFHLLALYTHYFTLIVIAIQGMWLIWITRNGRRTSSLFCKFAFSAGIAIILFLPWLNYDIHIEKVSGRLFDSQFSFRIPSLIRILGSFFYPVDTTLSFTEAHTWWIVFVWVILIVGSFLVSLQSYSKNHNFSYMTLLIILIIGGVLSVLILDYLWSYFFSPRQLFVFTPFLLLASSSAFLTVFRTIYTRFYRILNTGMADGMVILIMMILSLLAIIQPLLSIYSSVRGEDWKGTASFLKQKLRSNDILLVPSPHIGYYMSDHSSQMMNLQDLPSLLDLSQSYSRVWILSLEIGSVWRRYSDIYQWIQVGNALEVYRASRLRLYVYSIKYSYSQILKGLIYSKGHTFISNIPISFLKRAIQEGYIEEGLEIVEQALNDKTLGLSKKVKMGIQVGRTLSGVGKHDEAIEILHQVKSLDPDNPEVWANIAFINNYIGNRNYAITAYQRSLELDPDQYWATHLLAKILYSQGQWQDVISLEERAVDLTYNDDMRVKSLILMAHSHSHLGETAKAYNVFRLAYATEQNHKVLSEMALFLKRSISDGYVEDSEKIMIQILDDEVYGAVDRASIVISAGRALSDTGEHDKAIEILKRATSLDPNNPEAWSNLAFIYNRIGKTNDAIFVYQRSLELNPDQYWANHLLAKIYYSQGRWYDVLKLEQRAIQTTDQDHLRINSLTLMAWAYSQKGNTTKMCETIFLAYDIQENQGIINEAVKLGCLLEP
jgi:tetratricopeptide (TPR) repeat protein